ncbi:MAG: HAD hydrolase family protein [Lachnospiraceae bacterium]|nr:HAD hydrolase family protein [Lachnospiraceae bacterium]
MSLSHKIRMVGLDLDGTFLTSGKEVSEANLLAVKEALAQGVIVLPVTGRPFGAVPKELISLCGFPYVIAAGGASVHDIRAGSVLFSCGMPYHIAREITIRLREMGFIVNLFTEGLGYVDESEFDAMLGCARSDAAREYLRRFRIPVPDILHLAGNPTPCVEKLTATAPRDENGVIPGNEEARRMLRDYEEHVKVMYSPEINIEIDPVAASKGGSLLRLGEQFGIHREEIMAFGDSDNDRELLSMAGVSVAMGNAAPHLLEMAEIIAPDNDHDGVAEILRKYVLS